MDTTPDRPFAPIRPTMRRRGRRLPGRGIEASISGLRSRTGFLSAAAAFILIAFVPPVAHGQHGPTASPFLPTDHWSHGALARLHGAGLLPEGHDPASRSVSRSAALTSFEHAAEAAAERGSEWAPRARAYRDRLAEEFSHSAGRAPGSAAAAGAEGSVVGGVRTRRNGLLPRHEPEAGGEPRPVPIGDLDRAVGGVGLGFGLPLGSLSAAGHGALEAEGGHFRVSEAYGVLLAGKAGLWAGRRHLGFGAGDEGSITLGHGVSFDGAGFFLADGVRLPSLLGHLGTVRGETFLSRVSRTGQVESPWFLGIRGSIAPHSRIQLGLTRGVFFGGDGELVPPATLDRVLKVIAGIDTAEEGRENFENHTASADLWFAPPLGDVPLVVYGEWAVQDLEQQRTEMPGFLYGVRVEGFPGATWLRLGVERTSFKEPFANRRPWYDHRVYGTWTDRGDLLGHPLGGVGRELRLYGGADLVDARMRVDGRAFTRRRGEGNLFAPERQGSSRGLEGTVRWRLLPALELELGGALERGDDWRAGGSFLGGRVHF